MDEDKPNKARTRTRNRTSARKRTRRKITVSDDHAKEEDKKTHRSFVEERIARQKVEVIRLLGECGGIFTTVAKNLGVTRHTIQNWRKKDPEFNEKVLEILVQQRAWVEDKLMENINKGHFKAQQYYLRCKGRHAYLPSEGWIERYDNNGDVKSNSNDKLEGSGSTITEPVVLDDVSKVRESMGDSALMKAMSKCMANTPHLFKDNIDLSDAPDYKAIQKKKRKKNKKAKKKAKKKALKKAMKKAKGGDTINIVN